MIDIRKFSSLGAANHGWLDAHQASEVQVISAGSGAADADALPIRADARVLGATLNLTLNAGRNAYLIPATGRINIGGEEAEARGGVAITGEPVLTITALEDSEIVLVDAQ